MSSEPMVRASRRIRLREPFSGLSHLAGALLGVAALVVLVIMARGKPWHVSGFAIYGTTLIVLYMASALYHLLPVGVSNRAAAHLRPRGHLPADRGHLHTDLPGAAARRVGLELDGRRLGAGRVRQRDGDRLAQGAAWLGWCCIWYGWLSLVSLGPLRGGCRARDGWLFAGGLFTVGAVVFALNGPGSGRACSAHDLWHLFVLGGSACHFVVMLRFVAAVSRRGGA